jgi:hypothetical protein
MPAYLAGRFNLLIRDVYRGLLVGTGPLVDPGFVGFLSIPVHNFTSNKYILRAGEGFVYFEFTKLSWSNPDDVTIPKWIQSPIQTQPPFPASKNARRNLDDYIGQATGSGPAQNAIQQDIRRLEKAAANINLISMGAIAAAFLFVITTIAAIISAFQIYLGAQQFTQAAQKDLLESHEKVSADIKSGRADHEKLGSDFKSLRADQERSSLDIGVMRTEVENLRKLIEKPVAPR